MCMCVHTHTHKHTKLSKYFRFYKPHMVPSAYSFFPPRVFKSRLLLPHTPYKK